MHSCCRRWDSGGGGALKRDLERAVAPHSLRLASERLGGRKSSRKVSEWDHTTTSETACDRTCLRCGFSFRTVCSVSCVFFLRRTNVTLMACKDFATSGGGTVQFGCSCLNAERLDVISWNLKKEYFALPFLSGYTGRKKKDSQAERGDAGFLGENC